VPSSVSRTAITTLLIAAILGMLFVGAALATDEPGFCPTCHEMQPHYEAWTLGPHRDVSCIECHVSAGLPARFAHKFVALGEVYSHFTGNNTFPRPVPPSIPDGRCLACHDDLPDTIGRFPHGLHADKGACAQCHYDAGHAVTDEALKQAGVLAPDVTPQRLATKLAVVGGGKANLLDHQPVSCSRCHDMRATACSACHKPRGNDHPSVRGRPCIQCHSATGASWEFAHPRTTKGCSECHKPPANHPSGACEECHTRAGESWDFRHPRTGEHSYRSFDCKKCHPSSYNAVYCTCHKGRPPRD